VQLQVRIHQHDSPSMSLFGLTGYGFSVWGYPHCLFVIVIYTVFENKASECPNLRKRFEIKARFQYNVRTSQIPNCSSDREGEIYDEHFDKTFFEGIDDNWRAFFV
jgi:hypothetical protein